MLKLKYETKMNTNTKKYVNWIRVTCVGWMITSQKNLVKCKEPLLKGHPNKKNIIQRLALTAYFQVSRWSLSLFWGRKCKFPFHGSLSFSTSFSAESNALSPKWFLPPPSLPRLSWYLHPWDTQQWPQPHHTMHCPDILNHWEEEHPYSPACVSALAQ